VRPGLRRPAERVEGVTSRIGAAPKKSKKGRARRRLDFLRAVTLFRLLMPAWPCLIATSTRVKDLLMALISKIPEYHVFTSEVPLIQNFV
jgi:hypothetical protein